MSKEIHCQEANADPPASDDSYFNPPSVMVTYELQSSNESIPVSESIENTTESENSEALRSEPEPNFADPYL